MKRSIHRAALVLRDLRLRGTERVVPIRTEDDRPLSLSCGGRAYRFAVDADAELFQRAPALDTARRVGLDRLLVGRSDVMAQLRSQIERLGPFADVNVFVRGPTGSGKELVAQAVHRSSQLQGKLVALNCAALSESLIESELFGHARGAFTGAYARVGLMESADRGTLFLDEVTEMPLGLQAKLLRVIEEGRIRPVGANEERQVHVRFVSATNRRPDGSALRSDLFYRLAGAVLVVPPLRKRLEDIEDLAPLFLERFRVKHGLGPIALTTEALDALKEHDWPGNVRELKAVVERIAIASSHDELTAEDVAQSFASLRAASAPTTVPPPMASGQSGRFPKPPLGLRGFEREVILQTLDQNDGNVARTARELRLPRSTLRAKLRRYEVTPQSDTST